MRKAHTHTHIQEKKNGLKSLKVRFQEKSLCLSQYKITALHTDILLDLCLLSMSVFIYFYTFSYCLHLMFKRSFYYLLK